MTTLVDFTKLEAWQRAMDLAERIHELTKSFPKTELYGLTDQMRRASLSVAANIAEGFGRYTYPDKLHKYVQARGELTEVMTFIHHSYRVQYMPVEKRDEFLALSYQVQKPLNGLITKMDQMQQQIP
jgi:four helix bundle protein